MLVNLVGNGDVFVFTPGLDHVPIVGLQVEAVDLGLLVVFHHHCASNQVHILTSHDAPMVGNGS